MFSIVSLFLFLCILFVSYRKQSRRKIITACIFIVLNLFVVESICYGYFIYLIKKDKGLFLIGNQQVLDSFIKLHLLDIIYLNPNTHNAFYAVDETLGYTLGLGKKYFAYESNKQGFRSDREFSLVPNEGTLRMAVFGDSFVFCDGERLENTWPYILENTVGNLEVLNFGVSGYGLGQSYLRYVKDGIRFNPDIVFFNYVLLAERDRFDVTQAVFHDTLASSTLYRVNFWIENGMLYSQKTSPLDLFDEEFRQKHVVDKYEQSKRLSFLSSKIFSKTNVGLFIKNHLLKKYFSELEAPYTSPAINLKILENILLLAKRNDSHVIFFYDKEFHNLPQPIKILLKAYEQHVSYVYFKDILQERYVFHQVSQSELFNESQHYSPRGNLYFAEAVAYILKSRQWGRKGRVFIFDGESHSFKRLNEI